MRPFWKLPINFFIAVLCGFFVLWNCSSTKQSTDLASNYAMLSSSNAPQIELILAPQKALKGTFYVDSVFLRQQSGHIGLEIKGHLPDGCSHVIITEETKSISLLSWKEPSAICTMSLEPVHFFYALKQEELKEWVQKSDSIQINSLSYALWK